MGKAQPIYFTDDEVLKKAQKKASNMDRSLSYYVCQLIKKDLKKDE